MAIGELLADRWGLTIERVEVLEGGMNSRVWLVVADGTRLVVKSVDQSDAAFQPGLELAARLDSAGLTTGAPVPSRHGRLVELADGRQIALLQHVDGVPLVGRLEDHEDHRVIGTTLGRVHAISRAEPGELEKWFDLITQLDAYLDFEPWIRPAVREALEGVRDVGAKQDLTWAGLHGDPAAEAFLRQESGEIALIDWGGAMTGPALYDLASAIMYVSLDEHVVGAYLAEQPAAAAEVSAGLAAFVRFRWAVQASYFAWRSATDVQTGLTTNNGNAVGLADARRGLDA